MIFLYRFEAIKLDGALSDLGITDYGPDDIPGRQVFLLTNYERAIDYGSSEPFAAGYLPLSLGTSGLPDASWRFVPAAIRHEEVRLDGEQGAGGTTVEMPRDSELVQLLEERMPEFELYLTIAEIATPASQPRVVWTGRLDDLDADEGVGKLAMSHISEVLSQLGLTAKHPRNCPHSLYDRSSCGVRSLAYADGYFAWREDGTIGSIAENALTLTVGAAANRADGFFDGGFAIIEPDYAGNRFYPRAASPSEAQCAAAQLNGGRRFFVLTHTGSQVVLANPVGQTINPGDRITLFAGCLKTKEVCATKFNNIKSFGGFPFIPINNPFETGLKMA
jgi:hypothetical protein